MERIKTAKNNYCRSQFFKLLIPGTFTYVALIIRQISDVIIGGQFLGADAITGISLMSPIITAGLFVSALLPKGTCILFNLKKGDFKGKETSEVFSNALIFSLIITLVEVIVFQIFVDDFIAMYNASDSVSYHAAQYFSWFKYSICLYPVFDLLDNMVYNDGDAVISTVSNASLLGLTVLFSVILVREYGTYGIGLAAFISFAVSICILSCHFLKKTNSIKFSPCFSPALAVNTVTKSMPHASEYLFKTAMLSFLNYFIMLRFEVNGIVVLSAVMMLVNFESVFSGVSEAVSPMVGVYTGEKNGTGIRKVMKIASRVTFIEGTVFSVLAFVLAPCISIMLGIENQVQMNMCTHAVRIVAFGMFFESFIRLFAGYYTASLNIGLGIIIGFLNRLFYPCLLTLLFTRFCGLDGVWIALLLSAFMTVITVSAIIIIKYGKSFLPFICKPTESIHIFDCRLNEENVIELQKKIAQVLPCSYDEKLKNRIQLTVEELGMLISRKNGKNVLAEFDIWTDENPKMIIRYNGKLIDVSEDVMPDSLREHVFLCLQQETMETQYLMTAGQNRMVLEFI